MLRSVSRVLFAVAALAAISAALIVVFAGPGDGGDVRAAGEPPLMTLDASGTGVTCEGAAPMNRKCTVDPAGQFTLHVRAFGDEISAIASETVLPTGLSYTDKTCATEAVVTPAPGFCAATTVEAIAGANAVQHGFAQTLLPPRTAFTSINPAITMPNIMCDTEGSFDVILTVLSDPRPLGAVMSSAPSGVDDVAVKINGQATVDGVEVNVADVLTLNCGAGGEEDTPTPTATETPGDVVTPTVTETPGGDTPTPTQTTTGPTATPTTQPATATATATTGGVLLGDVDCNGTVNSIDALWVLWLVAAIQDSVPCPENADVNEDGMVDAQDALWILWIELELI